MTAPELLRRMHAHKRWANRVLFDTVADLEEQQRHREFGIGIGSAWATLVHLWAVDLAWIETIDGRVDAPVLTTDSVASVEALGTEWSACDARWVDLLAGLDESSLEREILRASNATHGQPKGMPLHDVLVHVCTHAQYTGAQCLNMLRRLRVDPLPRIAYSALSRAGFDDR